MRRRRASFHSPAPYRTASSARKLHTSRAKPAAREGCGCRCGSCVYLCVKSPPWAAECGQRAATDRVCAMAVLRLASSGLAARHLTRRRNKSCAGQRASPIGIHRCGEGNAAAARSIHVEIDDPDRCQQQSIVWEMRFLHIRPGVDIVAAISTGGGTCSSGQEAEKAQATEPNPDHPPEGAQMITPQPARRVDLRLYALVDPERAGGHQLPDLAWLVAAGGATLVQLRDKHGDTGTMVAEARAIRENLKLMHVPFLINDRVDVALAAEADGVHVGQDDMAVEDARRLLGPDAII